MVITKFEQPKGMEAFMQIDNNLKNELLSLNDESLSNIVKSVAKAAGINNDKLNISKSDIAKIRTVINNATDKDAEEALKIVGGGDNARKIINEAKRSEK